MINKYALLHDPERGETFFIKNGKEYSLVEIISELNRLQKTIEQYRELEVNSFDRGGEDD